MKKRKDGRYCKKIILPDGTAKYFYSSEKTEKQASRDIERQLLEYTEKRTIGKTFAEVADEWSDYHFPTLEHNTLKQYRPALADVIKQFGRFYIKDISSNQIDLFIKMYAKRGFAQKTVKTRLLMLNLVMKYAVINQYIANNPCMYITVPKNLPKSKRESLTEPQMDIVKHGVDKTFGLFAYFLLYTGLRKGEALALRYCDIDFDKKIIKINKTVEWIGNVPNIKNHPKTDAGFREVPLLDCLYALMDHKSTDELVFSNEKNELIRNGNFTRLWDKYRHETGLNITPHQLRHAYATMLYDAGIDIKTAQYLLGHANIQTTMDIYTHLSQSRQTAASDILNKFVSTAV